MAISITAPGGIQFSESPVVVSVTVGSGTFPSGASMQRCVLMVSHGGRSLEFGWDAENGESYPIDISSALRAFLSDYDTLSYARNGGTLPSVTCSLGSYVTYLLHGDLVGGKGTAQNNGGSVTGVWGGLSDMDRATIANNNSVGNSLSGIALSKKPHTTEIAKYGMPYPIGMISGTSISVTSRTLNSTITNAFRKGGIHVVDRDMTVFCFRNSLGVPETVAASFLEQENVTIEGSEYSIVGATSFAPSAKIAWIGSESHTQYEMSSGYVSRAWARWWAYEFLRAKEHWMLIDNRWWPVSISAKGNTVEVIDKAKPGMCHVDFTVKMAYSGMQGGDWMTK